MRPAEVDRPRVQSILDEDRPWPRLESLIAPHEVHLFALLYNWDDGFDALERILRHPGCDRGTALWLFWMAEPAEWELLPERLTAVEVEQWERARVENPPGVGALHEASVRFVNECRARLLDPAGFRSEQIAVEVVTDRLVPNKLTRRRLEAAGVPEPLLGPTPGAPWRHG